MNVWGEKSGHFPLTLPDPMIFFILNSSSAYFANFPPKECSFGCNIQAYMLCQPLNKLPNAHIDPKYHESPLTDEEHSHTKKTLEIKGDISL